MNTTLILPRLDFQKSYNAYIRELGDEERYPFPLDFDHEDFPALLRRLEDFAGGTNLPDGFVPATTYWLVQGDELVGVSNLRHRLNQNLRSYGGHIGLGVRPSYRGRGLGSRLLALTIQEARRKGIGQIHIHCNKGNAPSRRMIPRNGGRLESEETEPGSDEVLQRYEIAPVV